MDGESGAALRFAMKSDQPPKRNGTIDESFGFEAFRHRPWSLHVAMRKSRRAMAKDLKTCLTPLGRTWTPSENDRDDVPSIQPLIANDWTLLT